MRGGGNRIEIQQVLNKITLTQSTRFKCVCMFQESQTGRCNGGFDVSTDSFIFQLRGTARGEEIWCFHFKTTTIKMLRQQLDVNTVAEVIYFQSCLSFLLAVTRC